MLSIQKDTLDITTSLGKDEVADILGIDFEDEMLEVAYDTIDWDSIADCMHDLMRRLIEDQTTEVRWAIMDRIEDGELYD